MQAPLRDPHRRPSATVRLVRMDNHEHRHAAVHHPCPPTRRPRRGLCLRRARRGDEGLAWIYQRHARALHASRRLVGSPQARTSCRTLSCGCWADSRIDPSARSGFGCGGSWPISRSTGAPRLAHDRRRGSVLREAPRANPPIMPGFGPAAHSRRRPAPGLAQRVEGWSHQALGQRFGRSESWSKSIVSPALAQLRDIADHPGTPTHEH